MVFCNANMFTPDGWLFGGFRVEDGIFTQIVPELNTGDVDLRGAKVIPGLVDIHIHGCSGADFSDGDPDGLKAIAAFCARNGVTSIAPASVTLPYEVLAAAFRTARELHGSRPDGCARIAGIHMEGPFFSETKKGAQNGEYLRDPDYGAFQRLYDGCGGLIRIVDIAPELPGAVEFTEKASRLCTVSVGHTDADYEQAAAVFDAGASHLTHLFNAMPSFHHRSPGVIGAAGERDGVTAELICDGLHVHPNAVRLAFRLFPERICLISDSLRCCGMPDGVYELGGQQVFLCDGAARLADGTIAGSVSGLYAGMRNAVRFGIPEAEAIRAATIIPAREIGAEHAIGSVEPGKFADFVVCGEDLSLQQVYIGGTAVPARTEKE